MPKERHTVQNSEIVPPRVLEGVNTAPEPVSPELTDQERWQADQVLAWHRAETERLRVLADFLARPIHAHGGAEPDPDIITAYNLAVEAALHGIRRAAAHGA